MADTAASSSIILEAYTSAPFIKADDSNTTTWSVMGDIFTTYETRELMNFSLPEFNLKKKCVLLGHFMWMIVLSH
jgi:hypothetical protein